MALSSVSLGQIADERSVDLDLSIGNCLISEARIAGAEIVDREPHAAALDRASTDRARPSRITMLSVTSSSSSPATCRSPAAPRHIGNRLASANWRGDMLTAIAPAAGRGPARPCSARTPPQHPAADRHDQPGLFGQRNELRRGDQAELGMCQRSNASTPVIRPLQVDLRLVVQRELVGSSARRSAVSTESLSTDFELIALVKNRKLLAFLLGEIHRDVRVLHQRGLVEGVGVQGDADAGGDAALLAVQQHRPEQSREHLAPRCAPAARPRSPAPA